MLMMIMMYDHDDGDVKGKQISPGNADTVLLYNHSMVSLSHTHTLSSKHRHHHDDVCCHPRTVFISVVETTPPQLPLFPEGESSGSKLMVSEGVSRPGLS